MTVSERTIRAAVFAVALTWLGCADSADPVADTGSQSPIEVSIVEAVAPSPLVDGSLIGVRGRGLSTQHEATLVIESGVGQAELSRSGRTDQGLDLYAISSADIGVLGLGGIDVRLRLSQPDRASVDYEWSLTTATSITPSLTSLPSGAVYRDEEVVLRGGGLIAAAEGTLLAVVSGTFTPDEGAAIEVNAQLPVTLAERFARNRGLATLSTALGGNRAGEFVGTIQLSLTLNNGQNATSEAVETTLQFEPPTVFWLSPTSPSLGQLITVAGGGFLGSGRSGDESTTFRLQGVVTPDNGEAQLFGPTEIFAVANSGSEAQWGVEVQADGTVLRSSLFGVSRGRFEGSLVPIARSGDTVLEGDAFELVLDIRGSHQMVVVRFLPGFFDSLRHYGLGSAAGQVVDSALERMQSIFEDFAVDFITEEPADFLPGAVAHLEIGGPDPNGLGLLGYDNTPGKDVGNVRLGDTIGGANAETQDDGFPGYGGVFIDSFLYWSEDPGLPGERPFGAPPPDPLFDEMFGPVRTQNATLEEARGEGDSARVAEVQRAIGALSSMVGETAAHEVGHSLGLAQPYGPANAYHSPIPGAGCLMDSGADRPLGERAGEPGYDETVWCFGDAEYLGSILGR